MLVEGLQYKNLQCPYSEAEVSVEYLLTPHDDGVCELADTCNSRCRFNRHIHRGPGGPPGWYVVQCMALDVHKYIHVAGPFETDKEAYKKLSELQKRWTRYGAYDHSLKVLREQEYRPRRATVSPSSTSPSSSGAVTSPGAERVPPPLASSSPRVSHCHRNIQALSKKARSLDVQKKSNHVLLVESGSKPGRYYSVYFSKKYDRATCSCRWNREKKSFCSHILAAILFLAKERGCEIEFVDEGEENSSPSVRMAGVSFRVRQ